MLTTDNKPLIFCSAKFEFFSWIFAVAVNLPSFLANHAKTLAAKRFLLHCRSVPAIQHLLPQISTTRLFVQQILLWVIAVVFATWPLKSGKLQLILGEVLVQWHVSAGLRVEFYSLFLNGCRPGGSLTFQKPAEESSCSMSGRQMGEDNLYSNLVVRSTLLPLTR